MIEPDEEEHGTFIPVDNTRRIYRIDFMRSADGAQSAQVGSAGVELIRLVEPAISPRLVVEIVIVSELHGTKTTIEVPWHNVAALHWTRGGQND
jgi:hypothetical protein